MAGQAQLVSDEFQCQRHHSAGECPHAGKLYFQPQIHDIGLHIVEDNIILNDSFSLNCLASILFAW